MDRFSSDVYRIVEILQRPIQICFAFFRTILFLGRKFTNSPLEFRLLSAPAATTAAPIHLARSGWAGTCCSPGHHSARSPPPCTPLPATGRGKVAEHVRKSCALSRRRLATPSRESSASPARPGEAQPSEAPARRRRAPFEAPLVRLRQWIAEKLHEKSPIFDRPLLAGGRVRAASTMPARARGWWSTAET